MSDLAFVSAVQQAELVRAKEVSPVELTEMYLERIERIDGGLRSYVTVAADQALEAARGAEKALGRAEPLPDFHGVPISIKDLEETAGIRTTLSCGPFEHYEPDQDTYAVRRIREAGFIILGKSNTPEFGTVPQTESVLNGACRNPWNPGYTPGGSSGGAAAGVAAGLAPVAQGSDGGGSVRIPASCCGLFGIKPSRGRISLGPRFGEHICGLSTDGPIARTVGDGAALLDVLSGYETGDPYWAPPPERPFAHEVGRDPARLRVALALAGAGETELEPEVERAARDTAELLQSLGHDVEETSPDWYDPALTPTFITLWQGLSAYIPGLDPNQLEPANRVLAEQARRTSMIEYIEAGVRMSAFARKVVAFWDTYDIVLTPTIPFTPRPVGWMFDDDESTGWEERGWMALARAGEVVPFTVPANITGLPAVSMPLGWSESGLPIGSQLIGGPAGEATLIRLASQLEQARPWADRRPPSC